MIENLEIALLCKTRNVVYVFHVWPWIVVLENLDTAYVLDIRIGHVILRYACII